MRRIVFCLQNQFNHRVFSHDCKFARYALTCKTDTRHYIQAKLNASLHEKFNLEQLKRKEFDICNGHRKSNWEHQHDSKEGSLRGFVPVTTFALIFASCFSSKMLEERDFLLAAMVGNIEKLQVSYLLLAFFVSRSSKYLKKL